MSSAFAHCPQAVEEKLRQCHNLSRTTAEDLVGAEVIGVIDRPGGEGETVRKVRQVKRA